VATADYPFAQKPQSTLSSKRRRISIWPFTSPLVDLYLVLLAIPIFWLLGLEQILPIPILVWAFIKLVLTRRKIRLPTPARIALIFMVWQLVSSTSVDTSANWILFAKNFLSYLAGWCTFLIIVNSVKKPSDVTRTLAVLLALSTFVTAIGTAFILRWLPARFESLGSGLLPAFLKQSQFVQDNVIWREVGRPEAKLGSFTYPRVSSVFLYPTTAATGYLVLIPFQLYLIKITKGLRRKIVFLLLAFSGVNFLAMAARTSMIALLCAAGTVTYLHWLRTHNIPKLLRPAISVMIAILLAVFAIINASSLPEFTDTLFVATRGSSFEGRMAVYQATLESWQQRPLVGWGTPRKVPSITLAPAGTHSEYLGVLYRFGIVGLLLYLTVYAAIWIYLIKRFVRSAQADKRQTWFVLAVASSLLALNLNGLAHGIDWDMSVVLLQWITLGFVYTLPRTGRPGDTGVSHGIHDEG
jgi:O-antigen ligase